MIFLGTGAAELYPNPFCNCDTCQRARKAGAVPRKRSAFLLDARNLVDFGPDVPVASQMYNAPLDQLQHIFITHTHEDHFSAATFDILTMTPSRCGNPIDIFLSQEAYSWLMLAMRNDMSGFRNLNALLEGQIVHFVPLEAYTRFSTDDVWGYTVKSNHRGCGKNEYALNYRFDFPDGRRILYVADSGLYSIENLSALRGALCDVLIMEGTYGSETISEKSSHLNAKHFCENVSNMLDYGIIRKDSDVYVTHINQVNHFSHEEYQAYLDEHCVMPAIVAHDGLEI